MKVVCLRLSLLVVSLLLAVPALAELPDTLKRDFAPLEGVVVLPLQGEFLVDLDAAKGLQQGDLLAVVKDGAPVVHPVTREILGRLDEVKAVLKVVRVKSGYSYAEPIGDASAVKAGDKLKRAENLRALFWDYSGDGETFYSDVQQAIPHLEWQGYTASQASRPERLQLLETPLADADLVFVRQDGKLQVRDGRLRMLRVYNLPSVHGGVQTGVATGAEMTVTGISGTPSFVVSPGDGPRGQVAPETQVGIVRNQAQLDHQAIWQATRYRQPPAALDVADFDGDGLLETAVVFAERIEIGRQANGAWQVLQSVAPAAGTRLLTADAADLDSDGRFELYLTATDSNDQLASQVVALTGQGYQVVEKNIEMFFRVVPIPSEGRVLLGQRMGRKEDFDGSVFRVVRSGSQVAQGASLSMPSGVSLFGFLPFTSKNGESAYIVLNEFDRLLVKSESGETLYQGDSGFGGSMEHVKRDDPDIVANPLADIRNLFLQARLDVDDQGRPLVPANSGFTLSRQAKSYNKCQVFAFEWSAGTLQQVWQTSPQNGYLADFRYVDFDNDGVRELVMALAPSGGGLLSSRSGNLTVYEF